MGSAGFAVPSLERLTADHEVVAVYTQPERPSGRGKRAQRTPVHERAAAIDLPVLTPTSLKPPEVQAAFRDHAADVAVVAAYGLLLPRPILEAPRLGCLNLHGSILPRWRGAAPVERAIEAGDPETGVAIFQMEAGLDTGPVYVEARLPIAHDATAPALRAELAALAAALLPPLLRDLDAGTAVARPQPTSGVTYAAKLDKAEFALDWSRPAVLLERRVRAFHPQAWFALGPDRIRVLQAEVVEATGASGTVLDDRLTVACGEAALRPLVVQPAGKRPMATAAFLRGRTVVPGTAL